MKDRFEINCWNALFSMAKAGEWPIGIDGPSKVGVAMYGVVKWRAAKNVGLSNCIHLATEH